MGNAVQIKEPSAGTASAAKSIPRQKSGSIAPLSFAQQQIWLHAQLVPELPIYNEPVTIRRRGILDVDALQLAFTEIVRRHESWRTNFALMDGDPVQVVNPPSSVQFPVVDLSGLPEPERESEARRLALEDAIRPFDLSLGPLFRGLLVRFSENEHRLFLTLHHIIFDGYAIYRVLLPELSAMYATFSEGKDPALSPLPIQYHDFARWEQDSAASNSQLSSQLAYWCKQLGGNLPVLQLALDRPRPAVQSFRGAIHPVVIPKELADALKLISRREGVTLFMTLLAAFGILLHRYSSLEDIVIGTVTSGRKRSELENLLGYFLNPVVLRNDMSGNPTFREILQRTRNVALDALSNDDAPFTQVVNALHPNRSLSFNPLFQVLLTLEPPLPESREGWTIALTQSEVDTGYVKFDLVLELDDRPQGIVGRFKYSTDLFQPDTIARMNSHLLSLLRAVARNPEQRISEIPLLADAELRQLLVDWNATTEAFPKQLCLHEMFEGQAKQNATSLAIIDANGEVTYADLEQKSNQLAAYLRKRGVGPDTLVGLLLEPSREMLIGILAILKAGGVCVPLDPAYPADRIAHMLNDSGLKMLVTQFRLPRPHANRALEFVFLDSNWNEVAKESVAQVSSRVQPANLAYLIYTSGSTGRPKGVQITHRNLVHSTYARTLYYGSNAGRFLLLSSFAFDSSLAGIFGSLCRGGTLVLTPGSLKGNLTDLSELVAKHQVNELLCVPSVYSLLLDQALHRELDSLRTVMVAGESCPVELVKRHHKVLPQTKLINEYGPTEAAVWSTVYECPSTVSSISVPIGRPIPSAKVYVLDKHLKPLPIGVPGELCIGGPGVVRGYLNRPEETSDRFVPDPFSTESGARLYRTGDLVRFLPDGNLELLGRLDHQVKIRGFRVELEEIEAVAMEFRGVRQAVVNLYRNANGDAALAAYVVVDNQTSFDIQTLRQFLVARLPETMVPAAYILLEKLPLTPNGKVDRQALPTPAKPERRVEFVPSSGAVETRLVEIWESVLDRQRIGVTDNFFDLGGHSLLVAKLLLRIDQHFGKRLSLASVFRAPTIRELASLLDDKAESKEYQGVIPIQPLGTRTPIFWVRGGPLFRDLAKRLGPDQPFVGIDLPPSDASQLPLPYRLEDIAAGMVKRLREFHPKGPYFLGGLCVNAVIAYEMARILRQAGEEVPLLIMVDGQNPAYYQDFSQESRSEVISKKVKFHLKKFQRGGIAGLPGFVFGRLTGIGLRFSVARWRMYRKFGWRVSEGHLKDDLDKIVHPASYDYRPGKYAGSVVFVQSTDWPPCRFFDFYASWNDVVEGGMEVFRIPGGHLSMFYEENVDELATKLQIYLATAQPGNKVRGTAISSVKSNPPKFRETKFEDYPAISVLESRYGLNPKSFEEWKDLWLQNPAYRAVSNWPIGWVCEGPDGQIVGSVANIPLSYQLQGKPLLAATSRSLVMDSPFRSYSFSLLSRFFQQKNVDLFVNTTVNPKAAKLQELFHAERVPAGAWDRSAFFITNYSAFTASLMARKEMPNIGVLKYPMTAGLLLRDRITFRGLWLRRNGARPQYYKGFDERFDRFWDQLKASSFKKLLADRSRNSLEWHFQAGLSRDRGWVLTVNKGDDLAAYGIFLRQDNQSFGLHRMRMIDFQALPGNEELLQPILVQAIERCHDEGVHMLEVIGVSGRKERVVEDMYPHHRDLESWRYFYRATNPELAKLLKNPEIWDPTCFDGDSSL